MLQKLILLGIAVGISASIPVIYQKNPDLFGVIVASAVDRPAPATEAPRPLIVVQQAKLAEAKDNPMGRKVRIDADERGHFQADTRINGRAVEALVDTGATLVALNRTTARQVGLNLSASDFKHEVRTANGVARAAVAKIDNMQIGRLQVKDVDAMVLEDSALGGTLVGMSFLSKLSSFRIENGSLLMEQ
jgi:aspartyl protease family protein